MTVNSPAGGGTTVRAVVWVPPVRIVVPDGGAVTAVELCTTHPRAAVPLLSQHIELHHCRPLLGLPGFAHLLEESVLHLDDADLVVRWVADSGAAFDSAVLRSQVRSQASPRVTRLSECEREVLRLVAGGHPSPRVAAPQSCAVPAYQSA